MVERKVKVPTPTGEAEGVEVPVTTAIEKWSELQLEDGTILRTKVNVASVVRLDNQYDQQGNPIYFLSSMLAVAVVEAPEKLRRKTH